MKLSSEFWKKWDDNALEPTDYNPPQLDHGYISTCYCINWYGPGSSLFARFPCCFADCILKCYQPNLYADLLDKSSWAPAMLNNVQKKCPKEYIGVFWLKDHIQPSTLITIHDGQWEENNYVTKKLSENWLRSTETCYGVLLGSFYGVTGMKLTAEVSPSRKWVHLTPGHHWLYVFHKPTSLRRSDGSILRVTRGDMMRLNFKDWTDSRSAVVYQYMFVRVAWLDLNGNIVYNDKEIQEMNERAMSYRDDEPLFVCCPKTKVETFICNSNYTNVTNQNICRY